MSQSLSKIFLHLIFHVKTTSVRMCEGDLEHIHAYIGKVLNDLGCQSLCVGGTDDHVHILFLLSKDSSVSKVVEGVKRHSSRWIKTLSPRYAGFEWQGGYAAFSVSQSVVEGTLKYIKNQKEHHKTVSFAEEYRRFLELYHIEYNEQYVLRD
jgi:putative transposase